MKNLLPLLLSVWIAGVQAQDLSLLDDFGRPDIPADLLGLSLPSHMNTAAVVQNGAGDVAYIHQSGGSGNLGEIWQMGSGSSALVQQMGSNNELRLLQAADNQSATLRQEGVGNRMAVQMLGSDSHITAKQYDGSKLTAVLYEHSQLTVDQLSPNSTYSVIVPANTSVQVTQGSR